MAQIKSLSKILRKPLTLWSFFRTAGLTVCLFLGGCLSQIEELYPDDYYVVSLSGSTVALSQSTATVGSAATLVTVTAKNRYGAGLASKSITLTSDRGNLDTIVSSAGQNTTTTDGAGKAYFYVQSVEVGTATLTASASNGDFTSEGTIAYTAGTASVLTSTVEVSGGGTVTNGLSALITVTLKDRFGNTLSTGGDTVSVTSTGGTSTGTLSAVTDNGDGTYNFTFTATGTGTPLTIEATVNSSTINQTTTLQVI